MGIESEEIAEGLDGNDGAGNGILLRYHLLKKELQGFPGASTHIGRWIRTGRGKSTNELGDAPEFLSGKN